VILISAMFELGLQMRHNADHREASYIARDHALIPSLTDQNPFAHWRSPMDMIFQGRSRSVFQA
jgi:hypothetical protein